MKAIDKTVRQETGYIALCELLLSVLLQAVFLVIGQWNYTVLLGNLLSGGVAVLNFFLMGVTIQEATDREEKNARTLMRMSQSLRMVALFAAALVPLFFPRLAVAFRPLVGRKSGNTP